MAPVVVLTAVESSTRASDRQGGDQRGQQLRRVLRVGGMRRARGSRRSRRPGGRPCRAARTPTTRRRPRRRPPGTGCRPCAGSAPGTTPGPAPSAARAPCPAAPPAATARTAPAAAPTAPAAYHRPLGGCIASSCSRIRCAASMPCSRIAGSPRSSVWRRRPSGSSPGPVPISVRPGHRRAGQHRTARHQAAVGVPEQHHLVALGRELADQLRDDHAERRRQVRFLVVRPGRLVLARHVDRDRVEARVGDRVEQRREVLFGPRVARHQKRRGRRVTRGRRAGVQRGDRAVPAGQIDPATSMRADLRRREAHTIECASRRARVAVQSE